jgi:hypothetical protein
MFFNESLQNHLNTSSTIRLNSKVISEWNMNSADNILQIGNYRYRPTDALGSKYQIPVQSFSLNDDGNYYTDATFSDIQIDGGIDNKDIPTFLTSRKQKEGQLYSLEDCFGKNRPRSGINKLRYFQDKFSHFVNRYMADRPRYYISSREDAFKYWTSYRWEGEVERGIANKTLNGRNYIDDACPYVVYKEQIPANRVVVKMQTNAGTVDLGNFIDSGVAIQDPFYGTENQTTPIRWKIQTLVGDSWVDAIAFDETSLRQDGSDIIGPDGYLELHYGAIIPDAYKNIFTLIGDLSNETLLPDPTTLADGSAYFIKNNEDEAGTFYIAIEEDWLTFSAEYGWYLGEPVPLKQTSYVTELVNKKQFTSPSSGEIVYREFQYLKGLRIVVETMNVYDSTFDLIELSPRLAIDLSDKTQQFSIKKSASDLGVTGLPVSQLLAATGSIDLFDYDQAFFESNTNSLISKYLSQNIQFKFYEIISDVEGEDIPVPIKTMYSEGFPATQSSDRSVSIELRDLFYYFESMTAPQILITNCSLSMAISMLLDSVGFSNYSFKRTDADSEPEIPFFFIEPDVTVVEVLNNIAVSTQSAMFFDENNDFIVMSKDYMLPNESERPTDLVLYGSKDFTKQNEIKNKTTNESLANIISIASQNKEIFNAGSINYTTRYIQRSYRSLKQAMVLDRDKTWVYKPALLWEVSPTQQTKPINDEIGSQASYVLGAIPLNSDLTDKEPTVFNDRIINNVIDLGDGVYWITRYNGYFYANGEIIKYDAVQFSVPGLQNINPNDPNIDGDNVWITNVQEYSKYFAQMPFNGKMYPTGLVRIYTEPNYETVNGVTFLQNGPVAKHGRGQFDTVKTYHRAGLGPEWSSNDNVRGLKMDFKYLSNPDLELPTTTLGLAGQNNERARQATRSGLIKNFLASPKTEETGRDLSYPATVQSSAFVFNGTSFASIDNPLEHISYVYKELENRFVHFGTRMRIIGRVENSEIRGQTVNGSFIYYTPSEARSDQPTAIAGASGGLAIMLNPETNNGYYLELVALTDSNVADFEDLGVKNILFYKVKKNSEAESDTDPAIPITLWSGVGNVIVDDGRFTGQGRLNAESATTVYDIAIEYENIGTTRRFYLYINNVMIAIVDDPDPLPIYTNTALFVRGSSQCMFENIYALTNNYSQNATFAIETPVSTAFDVKDLNANKSFQKYTISGLVQSTYLSGLGSSEPPKYNIYYEEFGTIMRECAYFNVRYDKAYPALYAKMSPTFNRVKGYTVSNFMAKAYGAEFLIFNATDTALNLDSTSGNYLRIQGVTFTQESTNELTVDNYFNRLSSPTSIKINQNNSVSPPTKIKEQYFDIKLSRLSQGVKSFSLDSPYIQSHDAAEDIMGWMVNKIMKPSKSLGLNIFSNPTIQLGDIVQIDYKNSNNVYEVADPKDRFVVYHIEYERGQTGPSMSIYLSQVPS